jgi:hypothetical protein
MLIRSNPSVYLQLYNLLFALGFARARTLAGTFYILLCLCLGILLFLARRVRSLIARDCLRDLTFMRRIYGSRARGCGCIIAKELSDGV